jgi:hypothetical protein
MKDILSGVIAAAAAFIVVALLTFISAYIIQICWDFSISPLFHLAKITFWQAWFLNIFCITLFKNGGIEINKKD